jgi:hypothetical protein
MVPSSMRTTTHHSSILSIPLFIFNYASPALWVFPRVNFRYSIYLYKLNCPRTPWFNYKVLPESLGDFPMCIRTDFSVRSNGKFGKTQRVTLKEEIKGGLNCAIKIKMINELTLRSFLKFRFVDGFLQICYIHSLNFN